MMSTPADGNAKQWKQDHDITSMEDKWEKAGQQEDEVLFAFA